MENVTLDRTAVLQLDADGTDRALDAAADGNVLRDDTALDLRAIADQKIRGAQLTLDLAEDLRRTIAFDIADDRHAGADARACPRLRHRFAPCRVLNDRVLRLHGPCHDFFQICRRAPILLRCFALEHVHLPFSPAFSAERPSCLLAIARELMQSLLLPRGEDPQVGTTFENRPAQGRSATTMGTNVRRSGRRSQ